MKKSNIRIAVDAIIFGYSKNDGLSILLIKRKYDPYQATWALPGGFVLEDESLEQAVTRELTEETGITLNYLEQLYSFGTVDRDPRQRVVSVAYFGLINSSRYQSLKASTDAADVAWYKMGQMPKLAFDHKHIIQKAIDRLKKKLRYEPIGFELLDKQFAFSDLENLYAAILDQEINRRNFAKKILSYGFLEDTGRYAITASKGRPSKIYTFNEKVYRDLVKKGIHFEI